MSEDHELRELDARRSEADNAQFALSAATAGVDDATALLDAAHAELRRLELALQERESVGDMESVTQLSRDAHNIRDTVAACEVAVHDARRVADEYRAEVARLAAIVAELERR